MIDSLNKKHQIPSQELNLESIWLWADAMFSIKGMEKELPFPMTEEEFSLIDSYFSE
jgi:hypothetical protein